MRPIHNPAHTSNDVADPYSNTTGSPSAKSAAVMTLTKPIERKKQRPAHPKADEAQTRKPLDLADRAQFRVACASWYRAPLSTAPRA